MAYIGQITNLHLNFSHPNTYFLVKTKKKHFKSYLLLVPAAFYFWQCESDVWKHRHLKKKKKGYYITRGKESMVWGKFWTVWWFWMSIKQIELFPKSSTIIWMLNVPQSPLFKPWPLVRHYWEILRCSGGGALYKVLRSPGIHPWRGLVQLWLVLVCFLAHEVSGLLQKIDTPCSPC